MKLDEFIHYSVALFVLMFCLFMFSIFAKAEPREVMLDSTNFIYLNGVVDDESIQKLINESTKKK